VYHNLKSSGEFVVNVPGQDILRNMMVTAIRYPPETNELVEAGLKELPGLKVNVNRIKECKLHFECEVEWIKEAGNHFIVLGKVVSVTGSKDVLTDDYRIKFDSLRPVHYVGRGTDTFLESGKLVKVKREPLEPEK
jgi:flavin reductase (DIM6/NTAB) family NADH-FMN oxidoreductase RutF